MLFYLVTLWQGGNVLNFSESRMTRLKSEDNDRTGGVVLKTKWRHAYKMEQCLVFDRNSGYDFE